MMIGELMQEEGWVVCRVFTKKNYQRASDQSPKITVSYSSSRPPDQMMLQRDASSNPVLDQILHYMGKNCKQENEHHHRRRLLLETDHLNNQDTNMQFPYHDTQYNFNEEIHDKFLHLPRLDGSPSYHQSMEADHNIQSLTSNRPITERISDWAELDRLVASQLNGGGGHNLSEVIFDHQTAGTSRQLSCMGSDDDHHIHIPNSNMATFDFSQQHNDGGLSLPELPLNHFKRSTTTTNQGSSQVYCNEVVDLWTTFSSNHGSSSNSSSDPLGQLSV